MTLAREIEAVVDRYVELAGGNRFAERRELWDGDEPMPLLHPEEIAEPMVGWPAIEHYWNAISSDVEWFRTERLDLTVNPLGPDEALAVYAHRWTARLVPPGLLARAPIGAVVRVSMGLRKRAQSWRIFTVVESHVDGVAYFQELYRRRAQAE